MNNQNRSTGPLTRRSWLKTIAAGAGAIGASPLLSAPAVLSSRSPNSKLCTAVIGCGGRGETSLAAALGEHLVAVVDVEDARLEAAARKAGESGEKPKRFFDYREMFDTMSGDIDAVFVATPDHHHAPASLRAIELGKHVFCEKPLCHDIGEARVLAEAARKRKVTTMMGNQGHCEDGYRRVCEYIWAGAIGDVIETHSWSGFTNGGSGGRPPEQPVPTGLHWDQWLGPAPARGYHEGLHPLYWRYYWDFGTGGLGDWGCHNLDGVFWALKPGDPSSIECLGTIGGSAEKYPQASVIRWNIPASESRPEFRAYWYDGAKLPPDADLNDRSGKISVPNYPPMLAESEKKYDWDFREGYDGGTFYIGTKGVLHGGCYGQRPRLWPEEAQQAFPVPQQKIERVRGSHFAHFLECCKAGKPTCADFTYAAGITEFLLLGHLAIKAGTGSKVEWDSPGMKCRNYPELNRWVTRGARSGWRTA